MELEYWIDLSVIAGVVTAAVAGIICIVSYVRKVATDIRIKDETILQMGKALEEAAIRYRAMKKDRDTFREKARDRTKLISDLRHALTTHVAEKYYHQDMKNLTPENVATWKNTTAEVRLTYIDWARKSVESQFGCLVG